jgi:hypothetical protein
MELGSAGSVADAYLAQVHNDHEADDTGSGTRWGSGEIRLTGFELLGADGRPTQQVSTGDAITFRLHYDAPETLERPVFGLGIYTLEGIQVTGPNTKEAGLEVDAVSGAGYVDLKVDRLLLLPGAYSVSIACADSTVSHTYDHRHRAFFFDVKPGTPHETYGGLMSLDGRWAITPTATTSAADLPAEQQTA